MEMQLTEPGRPVIGSSIKLVVGVFVFALGVLLTLDNLDFLEAGRILRYWPVLLVAIGLIKLSDRTSRTIGAVSLAAGLLLLARNARWLPVSIGSLWPLFLIGAGLMIVMRSFGYTLPQRNGGGGDIWAVLSTRKVTGDARDFGNRRVVALLGGAEIEITDDGTPGAGAEPIVLDVFAMWGGIHIRVPSGWDVVGETVPVMGGVDIKTRGARRGRTLIVRGAVLMAGMEIKSMEARAQ